MAFPKRKRIDDEVSGLVAVFGVVPFLRFTAPNVTAGRADAKVESRSATLASFGAGGGRRAVEMGTENSCGHADELPPAARRPPLLRLLSRCTVFRLALSF